MEVYSSIDWLSITAPHQRGTITPVQATERYIEKGGRMGYKVTYQYESGVMHLWSDDRPEVHCIYSGKTLARMTGIMSGRELVQWHLDLGHRVTRIDTAIDAFDSRCEVTEFAKEWATGNVKTHARSGLFISDPKGESGDTLYVGSIKKRRKLLRIYDKAKEQRVDKDWIRFEMQYGQGAARSASKTIADSPDSLGRVIMGQMRGFCEFNHPVYQNIIENAESLKTPHDMPKGRTGREAWIWSQVVPALVKQEVDEPGYMGEIFREVYKRIERDEKNNKGKPEFN